MCVIAYVRSTRPNDEVVEQMWSANSHGGGVAWRNELGLVEWQKGLTLAEMLTYNKVLPLPYVMHFRIASTGLNTGDFGTHPFTIDEQATNELAGTTDKPVLFHNGTWHSWKHDMKELAFKAGVRIPTGPWTDTRALAFTAHHLGLGILEFIDEKVIAFGVDDVEIFGNWTTTTLHDGTEMMVTNEGWKYKSTYAPGFRGGVGATLAAANDVLTQAPKMITEKAGGTSQVKTFCGDDDGTSAETCGSSTDKGAVQSSTASTQATAQGWGFDNRCVECHRKAGVTEHNGSRYCWQCCSIVRNREQSAFLAQKANKRVCEFCAIREASILDHGNWTCRECYDEKDLTAKVEERFVGQCHFCGVGKASTKTRKDDRWMCVDCWEVNGKPEVYYIHTEHNTIPSIQGVM